MSSVPSVVAGGALAYAGYRLLDEQTGLSSDLVMARRLLTLRSEINANFAKGFNIVKQWYKTYEAVGDKKRALVMLEDDGKIRTFTFGDVERQSNKVANYFLKEGYTKGSTVALLMDNRPEFVISWLGLAKVGIKVAMINTSIKEKGLVHCIRISNAAAVLLGNEHADNIASVRDQLGSAKLLVSGGDAGIGIFVDPLVQASSDARVDPKIVDDLKMGDVFGYIYTSGTTGLPKAALILHYKMVGFGALLSHGFVVGPSDICYTVLPLFHSAGGGLGIGLMMYCGTTVVLRKKFKASTFMRDCAEQGCTVAQYIGELTRYLVATPKSEWDRKHKLRVVIGNGMRPEVWGPFVKRFGVPEVGEFYGATEGNAMLMNHSHSDEVASHGACGRQGLLMRTVTGIKFAKFDVDSEELVRDAAGRCVECAYGEPGELLLPIKPHDPTTTFAGYEDKKATEKKIARDAFVKGDAYFRTGDLLAVDKHGLIRFVDRIGDTFRWKGENCSTTEVGEVVSSFPGILEANVYGVLIPNNQDGRAPCAAVTTADDWRKLDLDKLLAHCKKNLPSYAVPLFIRFLTAPGEQTATLKQVKTTLRQEGIQPKSGDPMFYMDGKKYVPLTPEVFAKITTPHAKL